MSKFVSAHESGQDEPPDFSSPNDSVSWLKNPRYGCGATGGGKNGVMHPAMHYTVLSRQVSKRPGSSSSRQKASTNGAMTWLFGGHMQGITSPRVFRRGLCHLQKTQVTDE